MKPKLLHRLVAILLIPAMLQQTALSTQFPGPSLPHSFLGAGALALGTAPVFASQALAPSILRCLRMIIPSRQGTSLEVDKVRLVNFPWLIADRNTTRFLGSREGTGNFLTGGGRSVRKKSLIPLDQYAGKSAENLLAGFAAYRERVPQGQNPITLPDILIDTSKKQPKPNSGPRALFKLIDGKIVFAETTLNRIKEYIDKKVAVDPLAYWIDVVGYADARRRKESEPKQRYPLAVELTMALSNFLRGKANWEDDIPALVKQTGDHWQDVLAMPYLIRAVEVALKGGIDREAQAQNAGWKPRTLKNALGTVRRILSAYIARNSRKKDGDLEFVLPKSRKWSQKDWKLIVKLLTADEWAALPAREAQVVKLRGHGLSIGDIATLLEINEETVEVYLSNAYSTLRGITTPEARMPEDPQTPETGKKFLGMASDSFAEWLYDSATNEAQRRYAALILAPIIEASDWDPLIEGLAAITQLRVEGHIGKEMANRILVTAAQASWERVHWRHAQPDEQGTFRGELRIGGKKIPYNPELHDPILRQFHDSVAWYVIGAYYLAVAGMDSTDMTLERVKQVAREAGILAHHLWNKANYPNGMLGMARPRFFGGFDPGDPVTKLRDIIRLRSGLPDEIKTLLQEINWPQLDPYEAAELLAGTFRIPFKDLHNKLQVYQAALAILIELSPRDPLLPAWQNALRDQSGSCVEGALESLLAALQSRQHLVSDTSLGGLLTIVLTQHQRNPEILRTISGIVDHCPATPEFESVRDQLRNQAGIMKKERPGPVKVSAPAAPRKPAIVTTSPDLQKLLTNQQQKLIWAICRLDKYFEWDALDYLPGESLPDDMIKIPLTPEMVSYILHKFDAGYDFYQRKLTSDFRAADLPQELIVHYVTDANSILKQIFDKSDELRKLLKQERGTVVSPHVTDYKVVGSFSQIHAVGTVSIETQGEWYRLKVNDLTHTVTLVPDSADQPVELGSEPVFTRNFALTDFVFGWGNDFWITITDMAGVGMTIHYTQAHEPPPSSYLRNHPGFIIAALGAAGVAAWRLFGATPTVFADDGVRRVATSSVVMSIPVLGLFILGLVAWLVIWVSRDLAREDAALKNIQEALKETKRIFGDAQKNLWNAQDIHSRLTGDIRQLMDQIGQTLELIDPEKRIGDARNAGNNRAILEDFEILQKSLLKIASIFEFLAIPSDPRVPDSEAMMVRREKAAREMELAIQRAESTVLLLRKTFSIENNAQAKSFSNSGIRAQQALLKKLLRKRYPDPLKSERAKDAWDAVELFTRIENSDTDALTYQLTAAINHVELALRDRQTTDPADRNALTTMLAILKEPEEAGSSQQPGDGPPGTSGAGTATPHSGGDPRSLGDPHTHQRSLLGVAA